MKVLLVYSVFFCVCGFFLKEDSIAAPIRLENSLEDYDNLLKSLQLEQRNNTISARDRDDLDAAQLHERILFSTKREEELRETIIIYDNCFRNLIKIKKGLFNVQKKRLQKGESFDFDTSLKEQVIFEEKHFMRQIPEILEELRITSYYYNQDILANKRALKRRNDPSKNPIDRVFPLDYIMKESIDLNEAYGEIENFLTKQHSSSNKVYVRFINPHREDLVRLFGTDRYGLNRGDDFRRSKDEIDKLFIASNLKKRGLTLEDGLYLLRFDRSILLKMPFFKSFLNRKLTMVIYDKNKIETLDDWDGACFKTPSQKLDAVLGIILSK